MTTESGGAPSISAYVQVLRRRKWWVIPLALAGLGGSVALSSTEANQYTATAQVLVQATSLQQSIGSSQQAVTPTQVQTMMLLVASAPVQKAVQHRIGSAPPVTVAEVAQTNVIAITATSTSPAQAAVIANAYGRAFVRNQQKVTLNSLTAAEEQLKQEIRSVTSQIAPLRKPSANDPTQLGALLSQQSVLKEQLAQMQVNGTSATGGMSLVTPAQPPSAPSSPKPLQDGILGLIVGLIAGLTAAFIRDNLDDALSSAEETEQILNAPVLAAVPMVRSWKKRSKPLVVSITSPNSPAAEAYRSLRTSLQFARQERELRSILVTSPSASEGKTSTIANLGAAFAQDGYRVVLVSCDLRQPRLGQFYGIEESVGLTTAILGQAPLERVIQPVAGQGNLWMLPAGPLPHNPAELLNGRMAYETFTRLRGHFDLVLIDSPPMLPVTDAVVLSRYVDATLLIVAAGQTKRAQLQRAADKLALVEAPLIGAVLNEATRQAGSSYASPYGYGYGYGHAQPAPPVPPAEPLSPPAGPAPVPAPQAPLAPVAEPAQTDQTHSAQPAQARSDQPQPQTPAAQPQRTQPQRTRVLASAGRHGRTR